MQSISFGDLASNLRATRQTADLKQDLTRLGQELSTGLTSDTNQAVNGDFLPLADLERSVKALEAFQFSTQDAGLFVDAAQRALDTIQNYASVSSQNYLTVSSGGSTVAFDAIIADTAAQFEATVSVLNTNVGDRALFSGRATNTAALVDADTILTAVAAAATGATTAADLIAAVDTWFDTPGGGYETLAYAGSPNTLAPFELGQGQTAEFSATAQDQEIRDILKNFAKVAVLEDAGINLTGDEQRALIQDAGLGLLTAEKAVSNYRADICSAEAKIAEAGVRNTAEIAALNLARSNILTIDQFAVAADFEATQGQLETLYTVTARLSQLSLVNFLR